MPMQLLRREPVDGGHLLGFPNVSLTTQELTARHDVETQRAVVGLERPAGDDLDIAHLHPDFLGEFAPGGRGEGVVGAGRRFELAAGERQAAGGVFLARRTLDEQVPAVPFDCAVDVDDVRVGVHGWAFRYHVRQYRRSALDCVGTRPLQGTIFIGGGGKRLGMSEETIFTRIVDGEIPSYTVYEDETTYAFLDANPLAPGHTLVIPKEPYERLSDVPPDVAADLGATVSQLAPAVEAAVDAPASLVALHDGEEAGQEVPHVHWHIVPRFPDDGAAAVHAMFDGVDLDEDEMQNVAEDIRDAQS